MIFYSKSLMTLALFRCVAPDKAVYPRDILGVGINVSHLEILTKKGLIELCQHLQDSNLQEKIFQKEKICSLIPQSEREEFRFPLIENLRQSVEE